MSIERYNVSKTFKKNFWGKTSESNFVYILKITRDSENVVLVPFFFQLKSFYALPLSLVSLLLIKHSIQLYNLMTTFN